MVRVYKIRVFSQISIQRFHIMERLLPAVLQKKALDAGQLILIVVQVTPLPFIVFLHVLVHFHLVLCAFLEQSHLLHLSILLQNISNKIQGDHIEDAKTGHRHQPLRIPASHHHTDCHNHDHTEYGKIPKPGPLRPSKAADLLPVPEMKH